MIQKSYYGMIWAFITMKELTREEKEELFDIARAYLIIPVMWAIYLYRGYL